MNTRIVASSNIVTGRRKRLLAFPVRFSIPLALVIVMVGCASSKVLDEKTFSTEIATSKPNQVLVYDFEADLSTVKESKRQEYTQYADEARDVLANHLVAQIGAMGINVRRAIGRFEVDSDKLVIEGTFVEIDGGNAFTRNVIGFGVGSTRMVSEVRMSRPSEQGLQLVFEFRAVAKGSKKPGIATPIGLGSAGVAVASGAMGALGEVKGPVAQDAIRTADLISQQIGTFFVEQGWVEAAVLEH